MASAAALIRGEVRRTGNAASKTLGRLVKIDPRLSPSLVGGSKGLSGIRPATQPFAPFTPIPPSAPGFPPIPQPSFPTIPVSPFTPTPTVGGQLAPQLCNLLPENLRALCLAGTSIFTGNGASTGGTADCPQGSIRLGNACVDIGAALPGGDPLVFPADGRTTGAVVQGGFGLPATEPAGVQRVTRRCPKGMVLGIDNLCYAKAILPPRSKLRKWRRPPRPPVTRRDVVAIRRSSSARERVFELAKDVGLHVAKTPHRRKAKEKK